MTSQSAKQSKPVLNKRAFSKATLCNFSFHLVFDTRAASRGGAPQASYDKRRDRNCFQTRRMQAFPKKVNVSEVRGQLMRSHSCRSSTTSIYMLSVTDFDPKGTTSEVRVHAGAKLGHTGCWSIAKCRFSTKFSKSFDHHGKTKKRNRKNNSFEK